jgi:eukaryotic-like serine/threonine-protein kinase
MTPELWQRVKEVFEQVRQLDEAGRRAFVARPCDNDGELHLEVVSLLEADATAEAIVDRLAIEYLSPDTLEPVPEDWQGRRIGAYQLLTCLGRGGMGEVWRARRADRQFEKEVAIKLVRVGYASNFVLQRFRAERQILATLEHPNIARLIDGGVTEEGQPYLVMELVEGQPIDQYCESQSLPIAQRLRLFRDVCGAVSYAHQRLVVHRDLKPSNILVTAEGTIKLLDFGIAKILQPPLADGATAEATRTVLRALTPAFSSPEQILGLNITTASDVYSLGVVLFHVLAGRSPYRTTFASTRDAIQDVCETEPMRPSAAAAQLVPADKARVLPDRDLDDITLKALRKEPERRYGSVEQFSEDLRRYLAGLPVTVRGEQLTYRAGKFVRRHRVEVAAVVLIATALLIGIVLTSREARIANQQRARAERHSASVRALANTFMFQMDDAIRDLPGATAARQVLVQTALKYLDTLSKESGTDRNLQQELAQAYEKVADIQGQAYNPNTGNPRAALASYDQAVALLTALTTANPADTKVRAALATVHFKRSRALGLFGADPRAAATESQQSVALFEQLLAANPHQPSVQDQLAAAYSTHAVHLMWSGHTEAAITTAYKGIALMEELHRADPSNRTFEFHLGTQYTNAGAVVMARGLQPQTLEEVQSLERKALDLHQHLLSVDPQHALRYQRAIGADLDNLASQLYERGDYAGALTEHEAALAALAEPATDPNNSQARLDVARVTHHLARALFAAGRGDAAAAAFTQSIAALNAIAAHADALDVQYLLATCEMGLGLIETQRAVATIGPDRGAEALHWQAAHDWFAASVPRYEWLQRGAGVTLTPSESRGYDQAVAGLARSNLEIARLGVGASALPQ